jgi:hypothetical protein
VGVAMGVDIAVVGVGVAVRDVGVAVCDVGVEVWDVGVEVDVGVDVGVDVDVDVGVGVGVGTAKLTLASPHIMAWVRPSLSWTPSAQATFVVLITSDGMVSTTSKLSDTCTVVVGGRSPSANVRSFHLISPGTSLSGVTLALPLRKVR